MEIKQGRLFAQHVYHETQDNQNSPQFCVMCFHASIQKTSVVQLVTMEANGKHCIYSYFTTVIGLIWERQLGQLACFWTVGRNQRKRTKHWGNM